MNNLQQLNNLFEKIGVSNIAKLIFHSPTKQGEYKKSVLVPKLIAGEQVFQQENFTQKQVFHKAVALSDIATVSAELLENSFTKMTLTAVGSEHNIFATKGSLKIVKTAGKGAKAVGLASHNKQKNYILQEGSIVPPLIDMGVFTPEGKVVKSMYDKYKQINRFLEMVQDVIASRQTDTINVVDFGCGKSYLTFIMYHYLHHIKGQNVTMVGLDLKQDVIENCNKTATKYGYKNLKFMTGDIKDYLPQGKVDMVVSLHACDTATDYAIANAIEWGAESILSVPCCQHELNAQISTDNFAILTKYGIVKERISALLTDTIRANVLQINDYETQILEFVDLSHSPKNLLIRAVKKPQSSAKKQQAQQEIDSVIKEYNIAPIITKLVKSKTHTKYDNSKN